MEARQITGFVFEPPSLLLDAAQEHGPVVFLRLLEAVIAAIAGARDVVAAGLVP